jgi:hypothetical protein
VLETSAAKNAAPAKSQVQLMSAVAAAARHRLRTINAVNPKQKAGGALANRLSSKLFRFVIRILRSREAPSET